MKGTRHKKMKGITPIIAIIILLLITIALAGAAYTYLNIYFQGSTAKSISLVDITCNGGRVSAIITNIGTQSVTLGTCGTGAAAISGSSTVCGDVTIIKSAGTPTNNAMSGNFTGATSINRGSTATFTEGGCGAGNFCDYRLIAGTAVGGAT
ncbi:MAG: hypothetical protein HY367_04055, partial [Candidatus Aenigmarchaeota archaeon]|nr:hypothetical protein [Candidatus Aenigmarchaeota archaeon]